MSSLLDLPEEIIIIIIKQLDLKSVYNLYKTCGILKNIIALKGVVRKCDLSFSTFSTFKSLHLDMIKDISENLQELNMCGVNNLRKSVLMPAIKKMKVLRTLDVSYTLINTLDIIDIYKKCSTIQNLTINYNIRHLEQKTLSECQEVFQNFHNVHFVQATGLLYLSLKILRRSSLNMLKYTLVECGPQIFDWTDIDTMCPFKHLCIFVDFRSFQQSWNQVMPLIRLEHMEFIIIEYNHTPLICTSELFKNFFSTIFKIRSFVKFDEIRIMCGNVAIFLWNKESTIFDEMFFRNLKNRLKEILTFELRVKGGQTFLDRDMKCYDWFHISQMADEDNKSRELTEPSFKKRRIVTREQILDYDQLFSEHEQIRLSIFNASYGIVSLSPSNEYLKKITYLSLSGSSVRYSNDFFNILFRCCNMLITLNVEASPLSPCSTSIVRSIPLSQSLKNIRLIDKRIDFKMLFSSFSQCKTLENICVHDNSLENNELADLEILYQFVNLYSVHIHAEVTNIVLTNMRKHIRLLEKVYENYIQFIVHKPNIRVLCYDPYLQVFNINGIKLV